MRREGGLEDEGDLECGLGVVVVVGKAMCGGVGPMSVIEPEASSSWTSGKAVRDKGESGGDRFPLPGDDGVVVRSLGLTLDLDECTRST